MEDPASKHYRLFYSANGRVVTFDNLVKRVKTLVSETNELFNVYIGTDSSGARIGLVEFVSVVVVYQVGNGGTYFYKKWREKVLSRKERLIAEGAYSLALSELLTRSVAGLRRDLEIHLDINKNGLSKDVVREVAGMIKGSGYRLQIKPYAFAASTVADRLT